MSKKITLITDASELAKEAKNLSTAIQRNDTRVQKYLVSEIAHIEQHRNPTRLNAFLSGIKGKGMRTQAMNAFVQAFGNVIFDKKEGKYKVKAVRSEEAATKALEKAMSTDWTTFKPEPETEQFDIVAKIDALIKAARAGAARLQSETDPVKKAKLEKQYGKVDIVQLATIERAVHGEMLPADADDTKERSEAVETAKKSRARKQKADA